MDKSNLVSRLIEILADHTPILKKQIEEFSEDYSVQRNLLRGLMNMHNIKNALSPEYFKLQDELLQAELKEKTLTQLSDLLGVHISNRIHLFKGDITNLKVDAIVNAANSSLLGCFQAGHNCIDNCIHSCSGLQLRYECSKIVNELYQGNAPVGSATLTDAFNLPCKYVVHVVGPNVSFKVQKKDNDALALCYTNTLDIAIQKGIKSVAFCCISTGCFGFPKAQAARIAVDTVKEYLESKNADIDVIFNVFTDNDYAIYKELTGKKRDDNNDLRPFFNPNLF